MKQIYTPVTTMSVPWKSMWGKICSTCGLCNDNYKGELNAGSQWVRGDEKIIG